MRMRRYLVVDDKRSLEKVLPLLVKEQIGNSFAIDVARNYEDGYNLLTTSMARGIPYDVFLLDHDLGEDQPSGYDLLNNAVDLCFDERGKHNVLFENLPRTMYCVSDNPPGRKNIESLMDFIGKLRINKGEL